MAYGLAIAAGLTIASMGMQYFAQKGEESRQQDALLLADAEAEQRSIANQNKITQLGFQKRTESYSSILGGAHRAGAAIGAPQTPQIALQEQPAGSQIQSSPTVNLLGPSPMQKAASVAKRGAAQQDESNSLLGG